MPLRGKYLMPKTQNPSLVATSMMARIIVPPPTALLVLLGVLLLVSTAQTGILPEVAGREDGISNTSLGCVCHAGKATESVEVTLTGLPLNFSAGDVVNLSITITGGPQPTNQEENGGQGGAEGGFNLHVTGGTLAPVNESRVRIVDNQATHKAAGNSQRQWEVVWTAPQVESELVTFTLTGNAVNGDGKADSADQWNQAKYEVKGVNYGEEKSIPGFTLLAGLSTMALATLVLSRQREEGR